MAALQTGWREKKNCGEDKQNLRRETTEEKFMFLLVLFFHKDEKTEEGKKRYRTDKNNVGGEMENRKKTVTCYVALNLFSSYSQTVVTYYIT